MDPTLSICVIVKNEEKNIEGMIDNVKDFADEIIIVDTGSTDGAYEYIKNLSVNNEKIKLFLYTSRRGFHFGEARNFCISKATKEYILMLDADERLSARLRENFHQFLREKNPKVISMLRQDEFVRHLTEYHERAFERNNEILYGVDEESRVHEQLVHSYKVEKYNDPILHCQRENHWLTRPQRIFFQLGLEINRTPKTKSFFGHLLKGVWYGQWKFRKVYFKQAVYKDGWLGFKYSLLRGLYAFLLQLFVGLKPKEGYKYWEDSKYKIGKINTT